MTRAAPAPATPQLTVLPGGRTGRPKLAEIHKLEMAARSAEERAMSDALIPVMQRLTKAARAFGPSAYRDVAAAAYLLERHRRRWNPEETA